MTTVDEEIAKLERGSSTNAADAQNLRRLKEIYPTLQRYVGRWNKVAYFISAVNHLVDKFDQRFNCGCCPDSPLEIWPYIETEFGKVYSDPPEFRVGNKSYSMDAEASPGWDGKMREAGISESVISQVQSYFDEIIKS